MFEIRVDFGDHGHLNTFDDSDYADVAKAIVSHLSGGAIALTIKKLPPVEASDSQIEIKKGPRPTNTERLPLKLSLPPWVDEMAEAASRTSEAAQAFKVALDNLNRFMVDMGGTSKRKAPAEEHLYSTIVEGKHVGLALVFPPHWNGEQRASVLSMLDAQVTVSRPYIIKDEKELEEMKASAVKMMESNQGDKHSLLHIMYHPPCGRHSSIAKKGGGQVFTADEFKTRFKAAGEAFGVTGQIQMLSQTIIGLLEENKSLYEKIAALGQEARQPEA